VRGYPERALRLSLETVELAREGDPYSLSFALIWAARVAAWLGDRQRILEHAEEAIALSRDRGYPVWLAHAKGTRGLALGGSQGLEALKQSRAGYPVDSPTPDLYLARIHLELGRPADALAVVEAAIARGSEQRDADAELHRTRGEGLLEHVRSDEAEGCFRRAFEIARGQSAKSYELRAATSLARLLRDQGRRDEARAILAPVFDWFTEGFDTADLKDAKALLDELA
jgi:tetratricopeptide (TPR) repeat protein